MVIFGLGALAAASLIVFGTLSMQRFGQIVTPVCVVTAFGLWARFEWTRRALIGLLIFSLAVEVIMLVVNATSMLGPPTSVPTTRFLRGIGVGILRGGLAGWMVLYLRRPDVRALFVAPPPPPPEPPKPPKKLKGQSGERPAGGRPAGQG